jgi:hypothetical protein
MNPVKILIATLVAALVSFVWGFLSWAILPWHQASKFTNETAVAEVLKANAPAHDLYIIPWSPHGDQAAMDEAMKRSAAGPFFYGVVRPGTAEVSMPRPMMLSFVRGWIAALVLLLVLMKCRNFGSRIGLCLLVGLLIGLNAQAPMWIWMETPGNHTLKLIADGLIEVLLVGSVLSFFLKPPKQPTPAAA